MSKEEIMKLIEEDVSTDIYGDLYGHDRVAEHIAIKFITMEAEIEKLRKVNSDMGWQINPDRMGGQFTEWETTRRGDEWS